jgi:CP family cyanate transporter-like MFS transporter
MDTDASKTPSTPVVMLLLWLTGLYLRLTVLVAPPLAPRIAEDLGLGQAATGALTTLPILMLAVAGLAASWLISRIGARRTLITALILVVVSSSARGLAGAPTLFVATAVMGAAIAGIQPALPTLLTEWWPSRIAMGTAIYMNGMLIGEVIGSTLTLPVMLPLAGGDWRLTLLFWSLPALIPALSIRLLSRPSRAFEQDTGHWLPDWRRPLVWRLGVLLGASGSVFFGVNAYMGTVLEGRGEAELLALALSVFNTTQIAASLIMFTVGRRWIGRSRPLQLLMVTSLIGLSGFLFLSGWPALLALLPTGLSVGLLLILLVALPPLYTRGNATAALAAGMFAVGAITNFFVPLLGGLAGDWLGGARYAVVPILIYGVAALPLARRLPARSGLSQE